MEELLDRFGIMHEEVIRAIEEWEDLSPAAAGLKTHIGEIIRMRQYLGLREVAVKSLMKRAEESDEVKKELAETQAEVQKLQRELNEKSTSVDTGILSGILDSTTGAATGLSFKISDVTVCRTCIRLTSPGDLVDGKCPSCRAAPGPSDSPPYVSSE